MVASDFVSKYISFGKGKRDERYRLTDPFCLFYLHFIHGKNRKGTNFWQNNLNSSSLNSWREIAFENVSFQHVRQIKKALHVEGVESNQAAWIQAGDSDNTGVQIDLIIERADNVVNLCEMKFYSEP
ncbi:MAG: ATP-binding protein, partial [Lachnospiraceae bacterium]|nr:ATP-binding protein [Lachnospiraceae bacterium]